MLTKIKTTKEEITFIIPTREDLEQLLETGRVCYPAETLFSPDILEQQMQYNPECIHVLKNTKTNRVLGCITMSPMKKETLDRLINLEIDENKVPAQDYLPFSPDTVQDIYITNIVIKPAIKEKVYAGKLFVAILEYAKELLEKGIEIRKIYCVATTEEGEKLAKNLQFTLLQTKCIGDQEEFRHSYVLDIQNINSKHKLVKTFQSHMENIKVKK